MALKLKGSTSGFVAIDAPSVAGNNTLILPENTGSAHQILANDITAGVTTFTQITVSRNGDLTVPGTISIGGTLTYEDVTSVDSVGIVTARGLSIFGNTTGLQVASGISTFQAITGTTGTFTGDVSIADKIVHTGDTNTAIRFPAADTITFETAGSERLELDIDETTFNDGGSDTDFRVRSPAQTHMFYVNAGTDQVCIKTASAASGAELTVQGRTHTDTQFTIGSNSTLDAGVQATIYKPATNTLAFATAGANERLRITDSGKVNIGGDFTASTYGLQVYGSGGSDAATIGIKNNTSGPAGIHLLSGHGNWSIFNSETVGDALEFRDESANATRMLINSNGHLALGGTNITDVNLLTINGSGSSQNVGLVINKTNSPAKAYGINVHNATGNLLFYDYTSSADRLIINSTGNATFSGIVTATSFESTTFSKTPTNVPAFHAWSNNVTTHSLSDATETKVTFLNSETFDTDSAYDNATSGTTSNRFTVPTGKGGYYQISAGMNFYANANDIDHARLYIKKNTSTAITAYALVTSGGSTIRHFQANISGVLQLAAGDYLELFVNMSSVSGGQLYISQDANGYRGNFFSAFKLII